MKRATPLLTRLALIACLLPASRAAAAVNVGDKPSLAFTATDGTKVDLKNLQGKLVLVDFWATWCPPCMDEVQHMVDTQQKYGPRGLQIIGISLDQNRAAMENVAKRAGFTWPQYFDGRVWENKISTEWGVRGIPATFLLDTAGTVVWKGHPAEMDQHIEQALQRTPPVLVDPAVAEAAVAELEKVETTLAGGDAAAALQAFAKIPAEARNDPAVRERSDALAGQLAPAADGMIAEADKATAAKQFGAAHRTLKALAALGDMPVAKQAKDRLVALNAMPEAQAALAAEAKSAKADEELAAAQQLQAEKKDEQAYARFKGLLKQFPGTPAAATAQEAVTAYEKDPAFVKRANESAAGGKAKGTLSLAQSYLKAGHKDKAKAKYQEVIDNYPGTSFAETAQKELAQIK